MGEISKIQWTGIDQELPAFLCDVKILTETGEEKTAYLDDYNNGFWLSDGEELLRVSATHWKPILEIRNYPR